MLRNFFIAAIAVFGFLSVHAQDSTKTLTFSGYVDGYYRYDFAGKGNNKTSFTNSSNSFELGMASVKAEATSLSGKVGATIDLGFGRRVEEFSYNDGEASSKNGFISLSNIKQTFITYAPTKKIKFTAGKFVSHVGYEMLDAPLNRNYSMSYMFTNGPFFHTGLKADITAGPVAFMLGIANFTDQSSATTSTKNLIAQVSGATKNSKLKFYVNYSGFAGASIGANPSGLKALHQFDVILIGTVNTKFNIGYNGTVQSRMPTSGGSGSWLGNAVYVNIDPTTKLGITLRSEYISDSKLVYFTTKNIFTNTVSVNFKVGPLTIIPELRVESANTNYYQKNNGTGTKNAASALLAAVYKF
jgi:hypothetical protein